VRLLARVRQRVRRVDLPTPSITSRLRCRHRRRRPCNLVGRTWLPSASAWQLRGSKLCPTARAGQLRASWRLLCPTARVRQLRASWRLLCPPLATGSCEPPGDDCGPPLALGSCEALGCAPPVAPGNWEPPSCFPTPSWVHVGGAPPSCDIASSSCDCDCKPCNQLKSRAKSSKPDPDAPAWSPRVESGRPTLQSKTRRNSNIKSRFLINTCSIID
jgi:hypothetical protein